MSMKRALLGLVCLTAMSTTPAGAWWWNNYTYRNSNTTTIVVRPYNAFSDTSCTMSSNGCLPLSLLGQYVGGACGNPCGSCNMGGYGPACCPQQCCAPCCPPCYNGWPALYYNWGDCHSCSYPPSMYYPNVAYYPQLPPPPAPRR